MADAIEVIAEESDVLCVDVRNDFPCFFIIDVPIAGAGIDIVEADFCIDMQAPGNLVEIIVDCFEVSQVINQ